MSGGSSSPGLDLRGDAADRVHDLRAPAVAQRHDQRQPVVLRQGGDGFLQVLLHGLRQPVDLADDLQPDVVLVQLRRLALEVVHQVLHQRVHLVLGPVPVLDRERVEREILDPQLAGGRG